MTNAKVQEIVYNIVKTNRLAGNPYMTTSQIIEEAKKTPLVKYMNEYAKNDKTPKMERQIAQALTHLKTNKDESKRVISKGHGRWSVNKFVKRKQIVCRHIIKKDDGRSWCPVKECYIGDPEKQCNVLFDTDVHSRPIKKHGDGIIHIPRCVGFIDKKPNAVRIEMSKKAVAVQEEREEKERRRNSHDIHDSISKKYMPKLHEQKED